MVPVTTMLSPALAVERRTMAPCGTTPNAVIDTDDRPRRAIGVAAEERTGVMFDVIAETRGKARDPGVIDICRQRNRNKKSNRLRALCRQIRQVHPQHLAGDFVRRVVREKMHAGDDAVGGHDEIGTGRRRDNGRVVGQTEGAGIDRERSEMARDQTVFC